MEKWASNGLKCRDKDFFKKSGGGGGVCLFEVQSNYYPSVLWKTLYCTRLKCIRLSTAI